MVARRLSFVTDFTDRLSLNDDDADVRRWLIQEAEKLGCKVTVSVADVN
jgi:hypothetical protein